MTRAEAKSLKPGDLLRARKGIFMPFTVAAFQSLAVVDGTLYVQVGNTATSKGAEVQVIPAWKLEIVR